MKWWDWDSEEVLRDNNVTVEWSDVVVNGDGVESPNPWGGEWSLCWDHGFMGLGVFGKQYEEIARIGAALFVTLWLKGVPTHIASRLVGDYVYLEWFATHRGNTFIHGGGI